MEKEKSLETIKLPSELASELIKLSDEGYLIDKKMQAIACELESRGYNIEEEIDKVKNNEGEYNEV